MEPAEPAGPAFGAEQQEERNERHDGQAGQRPGGVTEPPGEAADDRQDDGMDRYRLHALGWVGARRLRGNR
ncbi:MAG: hypothetical protein AMXMBFR36_13530 [Acidobacteriota bacterium]